MAVRILLIENDEVYAAALTGDLGDFGHEIVTVTSVRDALAAIDANAFDGVVLERMLPEVDGLAALRWLRGGNVTLPIVMLADRSETQDAITGLDAGADDYMAKPIDAHALDARLRALVRGRRWATRQGDTLRIGAVSVSPSRGRAWSRDAPLRLSDLELRLLTQLLTHAGTVMTRAMLVEKVWGYHIVPAANIVDVHVSKLRQKLVAQAGEDPIVTVRGAGYMIDG